MQSKVLIKNILNSDWFIGTALFLILLFEYFSCQSIDYKFYNYSQSIKYYYYFDTFNVAIVLLILIILVCILGANTKIYNFKLELLARKFLDNAIGIGPLPFIFVIVFLIHVALFGSIFYDIFIKSEDIFCNLFRLLIFVFGLYFIFVIYSGRSNDYVAVPKQKRKILVTGLSYPINPFNIKAFGKPLGNEYLNIDTILVLLSKSFVDGETLKNRPILRTFIDDYINSNHPNVIVKKNISGINNNVINDQKDIADIVDVLKKESKDTEMEIEKYQLLDKFKLEYEQAEKSEKLAKLNYFLCFYLYVYYNKPNISIEFTDLADSNNMENLYSILNKKLKDKKYKSVETVINITPGTALMSSVLSLFAVKGNREMVYVRQDNDELKSDKLDVWSISEVISEFLDERERRDYK